MFHVLDHTHVVYSGDLSAATQYVIEHYCRKLDEAIRSGIRILYTDAPDRNPDAGTSPTSAPPRTGDRGDLSR